MNRLSRGILGMTFLGLILVMVGCSSSKAKTTLDFAKTDAYARQMFDAIAAKDLDAYIDLSVGPDDLGADGQPLMAAHRKESWRDRHQRQFEALLRNIEREGGVETLQWAQPGQPLGYLKDQNEFVGNIYVEVTVGAEPKKMVLEIGSTQEAQGRGRLLTPDSDVFLKPWTYYEVNVLRG
ncbi:MAG TPA: hypothetical protein VI382_07005 [Candidatus Manganitrophaceae bacterium]|nr:hypothetical protein [Candidatus Manganitrophaceae bacterium]